MVMGHRMQNATTANNKPRSASPPSTDAHDTHRCRRVMVAAAGERKDVDAGVATPWVSTLVVRVRAPDAAASPLPANPSPRAEGAAVATPATAGAIVLEASVVAGVPPPGVGAALCETVVPGPAAAPPDGTGRPGDGGGLTVMVASVRTVWAVACEVVPVAEMLCAGDTEAEDGSLTRHNGAVSSGCVTSQNHQSGTVMNHAHSRVNLDVGVGRHRPHHHHVVGASGGDRVHGCIRCCHMSLQISRAPMMYVRMLCMGPRGEGGVGREGRRMAPARVLHAGSELSPNRATGTHLDEESHTQVACMHAKRLRKGNGVERRIAC